MSTCSPVLRLLVTIAAMSSAFTVLAEIRIGFHAPLSGAATSDGAAALEGSRLAIAQTNARGGIAGQRVELVSHDDHATLQGAAQVGARLIDKDRVVGVVSGSYSAPTRVVASALQHAPLPYVVAYAIHPSITLAGRHVFRVSSVGVVQGRAGAWLAHELRARRISLITMRNDFGDSLATGFRDAASRLGLQVVGEHEYSLQQRDFAALVDKVRSEGADAIYASGYYFTAGPLVRQLRAAGLTVPLIGQEGYDSGKFIEIAGPAAEGVLVTTSLDRDADSVVVQRFLHDFRQATGDEADMVAAASYSATLVLIEALHKTRGLGGEVLLKALESTSVDTPVGSLSFNDLHEVRKNVQVQVVKNKAFRHHSVISDPYLLAPPGKTGR